MKRTFREEQEVQTAKEQVINNIPTPEHKYGKGQK